jgi:hypothetical protein
MRSVVIIRPGYHFVFLTNKKKHKHHMEPVPKPKFLKAKKKPATPDQSSLSTQPPASNNTQLCKACNKRPCAYSERVSRYIIHCETCVKVKRDTNNRSYSRKGHKKTEENITLENLAVCKSQLSKAIEDNVKCRERLVIINNRYDALQESYEMCQKSLADAIDQSTGGKPKNPLPCSISVRNEAVVIQRLQEITEMLTKNSAKVAFLEKKMEKILEKNDADQGNAEQREMMDHLESMINKLDIG